MKVLAHPDPFVLEATLVDLVARHKAEDPVRPVLVLVPTARLAGHVQHRIGRRLGACLGVHLHHYRSLLYAILERAGSPAPRLVSKRLQRELLRGVLRRLDGNPWREWVERRPGALARVLGAIRDLREAGVDSPTLGRVLHRTSEERWLARVYAAYSDALDARRPAGWVDDAGLAAAATAGAAEFARGFAAIVHHGAYELVGVHRDVLRELDRHRPVSFLLPADPGHVATEYAESFARDQLLDEDASIERLDDREGGFLGARLAALYDEPRRLDPLDGEPVRIHNAQGIDAEVEAALRSAIARAAAGVEPEEIAILARTISPFSASLDAALGRARLPWAGTVPTPLRRQPVLHDLLVSLRAVADDFPRIPTVELLSSRQVDWGALGEPAPASDLAERWSRSARLLRGLEAWSRDLPEVAAEIHRREEAGEERARGEEERSRERRNKAQSMARILGRLHRRLDPAGSRTWAEHADRIEALLREVLPARGRDEAATRPGLAEAYGLVDEMREVGAFLGDRRPVRFREVVDWLEQAVDETTVPSRETDEGGFRVIDAMQARGLTFRHVVIVGLNQHLVPRSPSEDPVLRDSLRQRIADATGRPLPMASRSESEERQLVSLMLGCARDGLEISWQRADDAGRAKAPSIALREVARLVVGRPDADALEQRARRIPSHPSQWVREMARSPGLVDPDERRLLVALHAREPREVLAALEGADDPALEAGLRMLSATQSFSPGRGDYDGNVGGSVVPPERLSVTALERLGRCPLQFFFHDVLHVRELEEDTRLGEVTRRELGIAVHALLESIYAELDAEGTFERGDPGALRERARRLLPDAWRRTSEAFGRHVATHLPVLWARIDRRWRQGLECFLDEDLGVLGAQRRRVPERESSVERTLDFGEGMRAAVTGRLDRTTRAGDEAVVGDYKTSGRIRSHTDATRILKGEKLQVPLYRMLAGGVRVEVLGVGPDHFAQGVEREDRRVSFDGFADARVRDGFLETVRTLLRLVANGRFPLRPDRHCNWCEYRQACRRKHPPTEHRVSHDRANTDYLRLAGKNARDKPSLAHVRAGRDQETS